MGLALGAMLPLAIGIAISPTTITTTLLMLLSTKAGAKTVSLLVGCALGVGVAVGLFALLSTQLPTPEPGAPSPSSGAIKLAAGISLVLIAATQWRRRPEPGEQPESPKWMSLIDSMTAGRALMLGALLAAVLPKNLLLALSAGFILGETALSVREAAGAILVFTAVAVSSVAIPVIAYSVAPAKMGEPLAQLRDWLVANSHAIMIVVLLVLGVVLIGNGIARF